jgi:hypothetical protein
MQKEIGLTENTLLKVLENVKNVIVIILKNKKEILTFAKLKYFPLCDRIFLQNYIHFSVGFGVKIFTKKC